MTLIQARAELANLNFHIETEKAKGVHGLDRVIEMDKLYRERRDLFRVIEAAS
jgi:hypothetical protein